MTKAQNYILEQKPDIELNITENPVSLSINEVINICINVIDKLIAFRKNRNTTRKLLEEKLNEIQGDYNRHFIISWLTKAFQCDITFTYAYRYLAQRNNREAGYVFDPIDFSIDDSEIHQEIDEENRLIAVNGISKTIDIYEKYQAFKELDLRISILCDSVTPDEFILNIAGINFEEYRLLAQEIVNNDFVTSDYEHIIWARIDNIIKIFERDENYRKFNENIVTYLSNKSYNIKELDKDKKNIFWRLCDLIDTGIFISKIKAGNLTVNNSFTTFTTHLNDTKLTYLFEQLIKKENSYIDPLTDKESFLHVFGKSSNNGANFKSVKWIKQNRFKTPYITALLELLTLVIGKQPSQKIVKYLITDNKGNEIKLGKLNKTKPSKCLGDFEKWTGCKLVPD